MTTSDPPETLWEGDLNEAVVEQWSDDTTAFDRVRQVIDVTTEPQSVEEIADRARVSPPTARKYLSTMAADGRVKRINTDTGSEYMRAPQMLAMDRIAAIHCEHTKAEIRESIKELKEERASIMETHEVGTIDELTLALKDGDDSWGDVVRWRQIKQNLEIAQAALALYGFDPDDSHAAAVRAAASDKEHRERGAFDEEASRSTA
jgi:DNA-binding Lrp family transcriptional regulator